MKTASAETVATEYCLTNGTSRFDDKTKTGYFDDTFLLYMYGAQQNGNQKTIEEGAVLDWTKVNVVVETLNSWLGEFEHTRIVLYKEGVQYNYQSFVSNTATINVSFGALPDGEYRLEYVGEYKTNASIFGRLEEYIYTYDFVMDRTAPTYTLKAGGGQIESGSYTNQQVIYTVGDANYKSLHYMTPSGNNHTTTETSYIISPTTENNGWWYFYAEDVLGARTVTVSVYVDTVKPIGIIKDVSGKTLENNGYTNKTFFYQGTDEGRVAMLQVKRPNKTSWTEYTGGTIATESEGWYSFDRWTLRGIYPKNTAFATMYRRHSAKCLRRVRILETA